MFILLYWWEPTAMDKAALVALVNKHAGWLVMDEAVIDALLQWRAKARRE